MNTLAKLSRPWFRMLPDVVEKINGADEFGLEYAIRAERQRLREREKKRRQRARQATERALVVVQSVERNAVSTFLTASGIKAFAEPEPRIMNRGMGHRMVETRVSLPFVSIQHREG